MTLDLVTSFVPTENGEGKLFLMEPGKRIVLDSMEDRWQANEVEEFHDQLLRVSHSPREQERREQVRRRCVEEFSCSPLYRARAAKDPEYWNEFYVGQVR